MARTPGEALQLGKLAKFCPPISVESHHSPKFFSFLSSACSCCLHSQGLGFSLKKIRTPGPNYNSALYIFQGSLEERVAGPGKRDTKLQGREGSTKPLERLGVGSARGEKEEKASL